MKIQLDIPKEVNKKLKHYKIDNELQNIKEVILRIVIKFFEDVGNDGRKRKI